VELCNGIQNLLSLEAETHSLLCLNRLHWSYMSSIKLNLHNYENSHSLGAGCFLSLSTFWGKLHHVVICSPRVVVNVYLFASPLCVSVCIQQVWAMPKTFLLNVILGNFANMYWRVSVFIKFWLLHQNTLHEDQHVYLCATWGSLT